MLPWEPKYRPQKGVSENSKRRRQNFLGFAKKGPKKGQTFFEVSLFIEFIVTSTELSTLSFKYFVSKFCTVY
jgi:hypothetical protein